MDAVSIIVLLIRILIFCIFWGLVFLVIRQRQNSKKKKITKTEGEYQK